MKIPGCEDAPVIGVARSVVPKALTLISAYYENPLTLTWQLAAWSRYPAHLRELLTVIVVDDGSPDHPAAEVLRPLPPGLRLRLFRIDVDVRWNQDAARNIAVHHATDDWILLIDIDHVVTRELLDAVIYGMHDPGVIHRFKRKRSDRKGRSKSIHPHPNSWLMTREMYWRIGGYDEALAGYYGTDEDYRRRCVATAPIRIVRDELVSRARFQDSYTTRYLRKQPEDGMIETLVNARCEGWRPRVLSFPYHEVEP